MARTDPRENEPDEAEQSRSGGSGQGGGLGTPSRDLAEAPPSLEQESNWVVSGGGLAGPDDEPPSDAAERGV
jgi:hypothetical protein